MIAELGAGLNELSTASTLPSVPISAYQKSIFQPAANAIFNHTTMMLDLIFLQGLRA